MLTCTHTHTKTKILNKMPMAARTTLNECPLLILARTSGRRVFWRPSNLGQARYATLIALEKFASFSVLCRHKSFEICVRASAVGLRQPEQSRNLRTLVRVRRRSVPTSSPELILFGRRLQRLWRCVACQCSLCD